MPIPVDVERLRVATASMAEIMRADAAEANRLLLEGLGAVSPLPTWPAAPDEGKA